MATKEEEGEFACLATQKEQDNFVKLCGDGDIESVTQLLDNDPSLIKATEREWPRKLKNYSNKFLLQFKI